MVQIFGAVSADHIGISDGFIGWDRRIRHKFNGVCGCYTSIIALGKSAYFIAQGLIPYNFVRTVQEILNWSLFSIIFVDDTIMCGLRLEQMLGKKVSCCKRFEAAARRTTSGRWEWFFGWWLCGKCEGDFEHFGVGIVNDGTWDLGGPKEVLNIADRLIFEKSPLGTLGGEGGSGMFCAFCTLGDWRRRW